MGLALSSLHRRDCGLQQPSLALITLPHDGRWRIHAQCVGTVEEVTAVTGGETRGGVNHQPAIVFTV